MPWVGGGGILPSRGAHSALSVALGWAGATMQVPWQQGENKWGAEVRG